MSISYNKLTNIPRVHSHGYATGHHSNLYIFRNAEANGPLHLETRTFMAHVKYSVSEIHLYRS